MTLPLLPRVAALAASVLLFGCASPEAAPPPAAAAPGVVSRHGRLQVQGNRIVGQDGQPVSLAGVSYGWSQWEAARFYNADVVNWLKQDWSADLVRAALGIHEQEGYLQDPRANLARVQRVIDAALAADLYVIIDWHDHHAQQHTARAVEFFTAMARRYGDRPNVIYEIYNEPVKASWAKDIKPYAEQVIAAIRAVDPDNLVVVGTPNFSQEVDTAAADPIKDPNVAYTLHFYAGTHKAWLRKRADRALAAGAALFVTEWGTCNADGKGPVDRKSTEAWLAYMRANQLSHCNWGIYDKPETASILLPGASRHGGWKDGDLSVSGRYAREIVRGWHATPAK